jgi:hypothetical protein
MVVWAHLGLACSTNLPHERACCLLQRAAASLPHLLAKVACWVLLLSRLAARRFRELDRTHSGRVSFLEVRHLVPQPRQDQMQDWRGWVREHGRSKGYGQRLGGV